MIAVPHWHVGEYVEYGGGFLMEVRHVEGAFAVVRKQEGGLTFFEPVMRPNLLAIERDGTVARDADGFPVSEDIILNPTDGEATFDTVEAAIDAMRAAAADAGNPP